MSINAPFITAYGDSAVLIDYRSPEFSREISERVQSLAAGLRGNAMWLETVPAYDSLLCVFDMRKTAMKDAIATLETYVQNHEMRNVTSAAIIDVPVVYGGEYGPDFDSMCEALKLTPEALIKAHSEETYLVCMLGFLPGFCFLSEAPPRLHHPRRPVPRTQVAAGSIGIAGWQTGIYGLESPGGWQIIGRTPLTMFDARKDVPSLLQAGDRLRFMPSTAEVFT